MRRISLAAVLALLSALAVVPTVAGGAPAPGGPAVAPHCTEQDRDCDEVPNESDNCPDVPNAPQTDTDRTYTESEPAAADGTPHPYPVGDPQGNACDDDDDADGLPDRRDADGDGVLESRVDNCQFVRNPSQRDTNPNDGGYGDDCPPRDSDGDGAPDDVDNCTAADNPDQADTDSDAAGDACDGDDDNDTVPDGSDNCPTASNPGQADRDGDGRGTACDPGDVVTAPREPEAPKPAPQDRVAPRAGITAGARLHARDLATSLPVGVRCDEACDIDGRLALRRRDARRLRLPQPIAAGTAALGGAGRTFVFLRARRAVARHRLARAPRRGMRATLTLRVVDEAGNERTLRRRLRLLG